MTCLLLLPGMLAFCSLPQSCTVYNLVKAAKQSGLSCSCHFVLIQEQVRENGRCFQVVTIWPRDKPLTFTALMRLHSTAESFASKAEWVTLSLGCMVQFQKQPPCFQQPNYILLAVNIAATSRITPHGYVMERSVLALWKALQKVNEEKCDWPGGV